MNYTINAEDAKLIRKFEEIMQRGYYASGEEVTAVYNRVLNKNVNTTNCSSCLRQRISEMVATLNHFEAIAKRQEMAQEALKNDEVDNSLSDENKATGEAENKSTEKKRVGRPPKKN